MEACPKESKYITFLLWQNHGAKENVVNVTSFLIAMRERKKKFHLIFDIQTNPHDIFQVWIISSLEIDKKWIIEWYSTLQQQVKNNRNEGKETGKYDWIKLRE